MLIIVPSSLLARVAENNRATHCLIPARLNSTETICYREKMLSSWTTILAA
jgi:hypothetical protein